VRVLAFGGKHKLANKWEEEVYVVTKQPNPDVPVYTVVRNWTPHSASVRFIETTCCLSDLCRTRLLGILYKQRQSGNRDSRRKTVTK
jgi:hypothetical protein